MEAVVYPLSELLIFARSKSPFYRELYKDLPSNNVSIEDVPIVDQEAFWRAANNGELLTGEQSDGIVFKSGGSTGAPKFSVFSKKEWSSFTRCFGRGMALGGGIRDGDRVANIFYAGQLYASFIFIMNSISDSDVKVTQFPLGGAASITDVIDTIREFSINVIAGVPTSIMHFMSHLKDKNETLPQLERILYGGEAMYPDQIVAVKAVLPHVTCQSIGWASVDGGSLGYFAKDCNLGEHRIFQRETIIEIVDEDTGAVIKEEGVVGKVLLTNLCRKLMPIIRYPAGDKAMWVEPEGVVDRRIKIVGRSNEGARVGPATVYIEDTRQILQSFAADFSSLGFQLRITHFDHLDQLEVLVGLSAKAAGGDLSQRVEEKIYQERSMLSDLVQKKLIHPIKVVFTHIDDLETNPRTGKLKAVVDLRFG